MICDAVLLQLLADEAYAIWSPFDAFQAADTLLRALDEEKVASAP